MPTNNVTLTAQFSTLPSPALIAAQSTSAGNTFTLSAQTIANQKWILKTSTNLIDWQIVATNIANPSGLIQFTNQPATDRERYFNITSP